MHTGTIVPSTPDRTPVAFRISVPQDDVDDLNGRLAATRFPDDPHNDDRGYGFPTAYLRELVDHWRLTHDWRVTEQRMNALEQYAVTLDGANHHVFVARGSGPNPMPIILSHGWPWTSWDFQRVIGPLADPGAHGGDPADSFDVVVPSLPGFGFSGPVAVAGWNFWHAADAQVELMRALGYDRFAAAGGDIGSLIVAHLGHAHADAVLGVYTHLAVPMTVFQTVPAGERPLDAVPGIEYTRRDARGERVWSGRGGLVGAELRPDRHRILRDPDDQAAESRGRHERFTRRARRVDAREAVRLGRRSWRTRDGVQQGRPVRHGVDRLVHRHLRQFGSVLRERGARPVAPAARLDCRGWRCPTAVSVFTEDVRRPPYAWAERYYDLRQWRVYDRGGHFTPFERPDAFVADVRDFFRTLR